MKEGLLNLRHLKLINEAAHAKCQGSNTSIKCRLDHQEIVLQQYVVSGQKPLPVVVVATEHFLEHPGVTALRCS